jgi:hypothetical protein
MQKPPVTIGLEQQLESYFDELLFTLDGPIDELPASEWAQFDCAQSGWEQSDFLDRVIEIDRSINSLMAARAMAIEDARRDNEPRTTESKLGSALGSATMARRAFNSELAAALNLSATAAENLIGNSRILVESLPATLNALQSGQISYRHAQIMIDHTASLDQSDALAVESSVLTKFGASQVPPAAKFDRAVRAARERLNPESIEARVERARDDRHVILEPDRDGMAWLSARLPAAHAHAIFDRLTKSALARHDADDTRTLAQRRADDLVAVLLAQSDAVVSNLRPDDSDTEAFVRWFRGITPTVIVTVPVLTLLGRGDGTDNGKSTGTRTRTGTGTGTGNQLATLDGTIPIDPITARALAGRAKSFIRVLTHPETGAVLSVGRKRYKVPKDLRVWLQIRDGTCRAVGCNRPSRRCDIDHTTEWRHGGQTAHDNLAHLCRRHHVEKSETNWNVHQAPDGSGVLTWTSPAGRTYVTYPETVIDAASAM